MTTIAPKAIIKGNDYKAVEAVFSWSVRRGFVLRKSYTKRKYWLFGEKTYYVEMDLSGQGYEQAIDAAIKEERYEDVKDLKAEYEAAKQLKFNAKTLK